jgi:hypothetical protein
MARKIIYFFILIFFLFVFAELIARAYYYRKPVESRMALYELIRAVKHSIFNREKINNSNHYAVRPQLSHAENDSIAAETKRANYYIYRPWVEYSYGELMGKYVNVHNGVRRSVPEVSAPSNNPIRIWFLGGSTMFGFNLTDEETIPSAFIREYQKRGGPSISVMNYGTPTYFSYQELIRLADNLFRDNKPDIVIMLDGLNEGVAPFASYYRNPVNTPKLQQMLHPDVYHYPKDYDYYHFPDSSKIEEVSNKIFDNYVENISNGRRLATAYGFKLFCFWQPVPFYEYPNRAVDPFSSKAPIYQFSYLCPKVKEQSGKMDYLYYLGDMLQFENSAYIESGHYTPRICDSIACRMLDKIFPQKQPS